MHHRRRLLHDAIGQLHGVERVKVATLACSRHESVAGSAGENAATSHTMCCSSSALSALDQPDVGHRW